MVVLVVSSCAGSQWLQLLCWLSVVVLVVSGCQWLCWLSVVMLVVSGCADSQWLQWLCLLCYNNIDISCPLW